MKKLITTMFLSIVFIIATIGFTASASRNVPYEEQKTEVQLAEERKLYGGRTKAEFEARGENIAKSAEGVYEEFHEKYTDDQYGGMWFDDEGYLNIYLLEENKALETDGLNTKSKIREQKGLVEQNEYIKVHYGKYSLAELKAAQKEVSNFLDSIIDIVNGGWMLGAKASINRVDLQLPIEFRDSDNEQIVALRNQLEAMDIVAITYSQAMDDMPSYEDCLQTNDHSVEIDDNAVVEASSSLPSYNIWLGAPVYTAGGDFALAYATKDLYGTVGWITAGLLLTL